MQCEVSSPNNQLFAARTIGSPCKHSVENDSQQPAKVLFWCLIQPVFIKAIEQPP